jgi:hypothetical protein
MRAESDWAPVVGVGRIQDKTRWTKAMGDAATFPYGDCNEEIELSQHSSTVGCEKTGQALRQRLVATVYASAFCPCSRAECFQNLPGIQVN